MAAAGLEDALDLVRTEARRAPLLALADDLRATLDSGRLQASATLTVLGQLLDELSLLDWEGRWGRTFALRDRLRLGIAEGASSEGMDHRDWGLWWALIEELDRLERLEVARG